METKTMDEYVNGNEELLQKIPDSDFINVEQDLAMYIMVVTIISLCV